MSWIVNLLDDAYGSILSHPENILNEYFMINIFQSIAAKVPPFQEYLYQTGWAIWEHFVFDNIIFQMYDCVRIHAVKERS